MPWATSTEVQSLLFSRAQWTPASARAWAKEHGYRTPKPDITAGTIRLRQHSPDEYQKGRLRTITFGTGGAGIKAIVGPPRGDTGRAKQRAKGRHNPGKKIGRRNPSELRLVRVATEQYATEDGTIQVYKGRTWSASRGSYAFTGWTAKIVKNVKPEFEAARVAKRSVDVAAYEIAHAPTLALLKERLAKYLADREAGTLGDRHRYGFAMDRRPVARNPKARANGKATRTNGLRPGMLVKTPSHGTGTVVRVGKMVDVFAGGQTIRVSPDRLTPA